MKKIINKLIHLDTYLDKQTPILLLLVLVLALRIPNLFEPYWYGDEGIYLTLGQSMNKGALLYTEIIDHKTPLIYYLARVQTQLNFRMLTIAWMMVTTTSFYFLTKKIFSSVLLSTVATTLFVLLTTLPWFEGHIPNGELFVLGFVLTGFLVATKSNYFSTVTETKLQTKNNYLPLYVSGVLVGLGILTKVPAVLDSAALLSIGYFTILGSKTFTKSLITTLVHWATIITGMVTPIILSIAYFISIGSGKDYLDFGLLYNFRYASSWQLPFNNPVLLFAFTLLGKTLILGLIVLGISLLKKYLKPTTQFILSWFALALFATLLSNRPYPHYFIQLVPPLVLLLTVIAKNKIELLRGLMKKNWTSLVPSTLSLLFATVLILVFVSILFGLKVGLYPVTTYYKNWYRLVTRQMSVEEYRQSFNHLMKDNYAATEIITASGARDLFIWGTNPMLYAQTQTQPTGRFTVSFHIKDFNAFDETFNDLVRKAPPYIVVMKNEDYQFEKLNEYISANYSPHYAKFDNFVLWKRN